MSILLAVVGSLAAALAVAWAARRLLGAQRVSAARTLLAAALGLALGWGVGILLDRNADLTTEDTVVTATVLAVLFTMIVVIGFELASGQPRHRRDSTRSNPFTAARNSWNDTRRVSEIVGIARRQGLFTTAAAVFSDESDHHAEVEFGRSLRVTLEQLGGVYVKLGQILSTRPDVLPPASLEELSHLQGDVTPTQRSVMEPYLTEELGRSPLDVFSDFDWDPIGSASIGQVYRARLKSGDEVVVKVRRPGVADAVERDLGVIVRVAETLERRTEFARTYGAVAFARGFATALRSELDYRHELANTERIERSFRDHPALHVPVVHPEHSGEAILVMEMVRGVDVGQAARSGAVPADGPTLAGELFQAQMEAMVEGGEFHADPHPGNVIIMGPGQLALIDFGSTSRLDAFERGAVTDILTALQMRDPTLLREAITQVASIPDGTSPEALERALARLLADRLAPGMEPTPELITDFLSLVRTFRIQLPPTLLLVFRTLGTMLGTLDILDPEFSIIDAARSVAGDGVQDRLSPSKVEEVLREETLALVPLLRRAPRHMDRIAGQLERGELTVRSRFLSHPDDVRTLTAIVNRAILAFVGAALGIVSVFMLRTTGGPALTADFRLYEMLGLLGLVMGSVLLMRVVLEALGPDP